MNKNQRIIKFVRKELQSSESIIPKKQSREKEQNGERLKQEVSNKEEQKLKEYLAYFQPKSPEQSKKKSLKNINSQIPGSQQREKAMPKVDNSKDKPESINFDKKLLKISMPDELQRVRFIKKLENKLCSCLERKKPQIQMKKLVKVELLSSILDKKQRTVITKVPNYNEHLQNEPQSLRKTQQKITNRRSKQKSQLIQQKNSDKHGYLKSLSLKIPELHHSAQNAQFNFQTHFNFQEDNQADSIFINMTSENDQLPSSDCFNPFQNNQVNKNNSQFPFQKYYEDNNRSYHPFSDQFSQNNHHLNNKQQTSNHIYFKKPPNKHYEERTLSDNYIDINKIKIPKVQQSRPDSKNSMFYHMLPVVEEQASKFYSTEKSFNSNNNDYNHHQEPQRRSHYWPQSTQSGGKYSHQNSNPFY